MIDFSAIETEIATIIGSAGWNSVEKGRIRMDEVLTPALMPSLDIAADEHETREIGYTRNYRVPVLLAIRRMDWDRKQNADAFKLLLEGICTKLEASGHGTHYDVIREVRSRMDDLPPGSGQLIRTGIITLVCLAHS